MVPPLENTNKRDYTRQWKNLQIRFEVRDYQGFLPCGTGSVSIRRFSRALNKKSSKAN
jgi:hypothetical protein